MAKTKDRHPGGRPTDYTPEIAEVVCQRIAEGESVRGICADEDMPSVRTFFRWVGKYEEFRQQYAIAREQQMESFADEILDISDNGTNDYMSNNDPENPGYKFNGEHYQRARLRVDTRKWLMSKMAPKKYGDKLQVAGDGGGPIEHRHTISDALADKLADVVGKKC